jgi:hypothetical protein
MSKNSTNTATFDGRPNLISLDDTIEKRLEEFIEKHGISTRLLLRNFPLFMRRVALKRMLTHYELFRMVVDLPGDLVELGVYRGTSLLSWANFLESRNIGDRTRRVIGFDNFKGFRELSPQDGPPSEKAGKVPSGFDCSDLEEQLEEMISIFDADRFVPQKPRIHLIKGDIEETVPKFVAEQPGTRISLIHFDCDVYKPTLCGLRHLWPLVVAGGVVIFDEYGIEPWAGESKAADDYFAEIGYRPNWRKFDWHATPGAYLVK